MFKQMIKKKKNSFMYINFSRSHDLLFINKIKIVIMPKHNL